MIFQPCIALSRSAIVHVVVQIRDDPADDRQLSEIVWETREVAEGSPETNQTKPLVIQDGRSQETF